MHLWASIIGREGVMLATLLALGSAPASFLGRRFKAASRVAMAPVLGLSLGTSVFSTLIWFTSARNTYWLLGLLALASLAIAAWRGLASVHSPQEQPSQSRVGVLARRMVVLARRLRPLDLLALVGVCVVVSAPLSYTLHERDSVGPVGYEIWDADDYSTEPDAMEQQSIRQAIAPYSLAVLAYVKGKGDRSFHPSLASTNFSRIFWTIFSSSYQNIDASPLSANLNATIGLHGTDTQTLFLIAFLIAGALGAFAAVRYFAPTPGWAAPLAGVLFAGPFFLQLMVDGSQAATCGLALILPITAVGADVLREARWASLAVFALLVSGLSALYPLFVPGVAICGAAILAVLAIRAHMGGRLDSRMLWRGIGAVAFVIVLSILFDVVVFLRDVRYWHEVLRGADYYSTLPQYHLPFSVLPGWLFQTREFYSLTSLGNASVWQLALAVVLPIFVVLAMLFSLGRRRGGLFIAALLSIYAAMALYNSTAHHCSYCTERAMLPIAPLSVGLFALGVAALARMPRAWLRWTGIAVAVVLLLAVAERTRRERILFSAGAYFLESGNREALSHLPRHPGAVDIEGYGENPGTSVGEVPFVYWLVSERTGGAVSISTEYNDYSGLAYVGEANPRNPQFDPDYRYVLTRFGGVETGRRTIARVGSLALQERTGSLDVTLLSGVGVPILRLDSDGLAWVEAPMHMLVVGGGPGKVWVSMRLRVIAKANIAHQPGLTIKALGGQLYSVCVPVTGAPPTRKATLSIDFEHEPPPESPEPFEASEPPRGVQLVGMSAVDRCSSGASAGTAVQ